jgi:predicted enzyme related to lactoylglutathione lyase
LEIDVPSALHPIIVTTDVERLLRFYAELLGAAETSRYPDDGPVFFVGLQIRDAELGLAANTDAAVPAGRIILTAEVPDVNALVEKVEQLGGEVLSPSNDMPWGQRVAHVHDPDGNTLNLTQQL